MEYHRRGASVMLFVNPKGELLLQLRDNVPSIPFPNHWGCLGGGIELGETPAQALEREVREEIGLQPASYEPWGTYPALSGEIHIFAALLDHDAHLLRLTEGQRVQWFSPQAAMMLPLVPWLEHVLPAFARSEVYAKLCADAGLRVGNDEAASLVFVNHAGELLLRLRDDKPGILFPGRWDLIGGALEPGEDPGQAALRETREELGFAPDAPAYWRSIRGIVLIHVFAARLDVDAETLCLTEGQRVEWFLPSHALRLPLVPYMERLVPAFAESRLYVRLRDA